MTLAAAVAHLQAGEPRLAIPILEAHLARQADDAHAWFLLGACRHALEDFPRALDALTRSSCLSSATAEPHVALAEVACEAGDPGAALAAAERGLERFPAEPRLFHAAGMALERLGRAKEALRRYEAALAIAPNAEDTVHDHGLLLARLGRLDEAESQYRRHLTAHPGAARIRVSLADALLAQGRYEETLELFGPGPHDALTLVRCGFALSALRRFSEARQAFGIACARDAKAVEQFIRRVAPAADPDLILSAENIFLERCHAALRQADWSRWEAMVEESRRVASTPDALLEPAVGFMILTLPLSGSERHAVARRIAVPIEEKAPVLPPRAAPEGSKIRVGILSPDFREHLNADLLLPLFELLDRGQFQINAYSLAAGDGSTARARIRAASDTFVDLAGLGDDDAARQIRRDDIDILVDTAGHTTGGRFEIMARRPARLHVNFLGFSCSLGSKRIDYAIVDRIAAGSQDEWSEALAYVPRPYFLYDYRARVPEISVSGADYGLPEGSFVYCAFHRAEKISPDTFAMWMEILLRVPRAVLWLLAQPGSAERNLRQHASRHGVEPARLIFAPFEPRHGPRYLARQRLGGLFLDALHHNAMTTACDALGVGLPLLTLPGHAIAARTGASLLHAAGLPELVASDRDDFIATAVRLAAEPALLHEYRQRLRHNRASAPLFDTPRRVRDLETAFEHMHARALRGEPPASFDV